MLYGPRARHDPVRKYEISFLNKLPSPKKTYTVGYSTGLIRAVYLLCDFSGCCGFGIFFHPPAAR